MAVQMCDVEVWVMVNAEGEYIAHHDPDRLGELYGEEIGDIAEAGGLRRVKVTLKVPMPTPFEVSGEIAGEGDEPGSLEAA